MKIGLLADIHGNADALSAVLDKARNIGVRRLLVAGDIVGYYYGVERVLQLLNEWDWVAISGNHEAMLADWYNEKNREKIRRKYGSSLEVTCENIDQHTIDFLINLPITKQLNIEEKTVLLCHGCPWDRDTYIYPDSKACVQEKMFSEGIDLTIFGHTHYPVIWSENGRYVVNPGSVGQPRDRKPGACWACWDTEEMTVELHRESYSADDLIKQCHTLDPELPYLADVLVRT